MDIMSTKQVAAEEPSGQNESSSAIMTTRYRGYQLQCVRAPRGWSMLIGDPAGHPADVLLHRHFDHTGWLSRSDADRAARLYVDAIYEQSGSY